MSEKGQKDTMDKYFVKSNPETSQHQGEVSSVDEPKEIPATSKKMSPRSEYSTPPDTDPFIPSASETSLRSGLATPRRKVASFGPIGPRKGHKSRRSTFSGPVPSSSQDSLTKVPDEQNLDDTSSQGSTTDSLGKEAGPTKSVESMDVDDPNLMTVDSSSSVEEDYCLDWTGSRM